ncbi:MAG: hypothetical protein NTY77_06310 [Elusimicrobia bacterium]|nr:hypothetical protein [Elusimicrobiota bacterium]
MPEPVNTGGPALPTQAPSLAWVWAFLAFLALAVVSAWREVPFYLAPAASEQASSRTVERIAVLPFDDIRVASPYAVGLDRGKATDVPAAVRREASDHGEEVVCELGAGSNHLGRADGEALAQALAQELARTGEYASVRYVEGPDELKDETAVIHGKVLEAQLRILKDGKREYSVGVELSAARWLCVARAELPPFWQRSLRRKARSGGAGAVYEVSALVRALCADAAEKLGDASWN